MEHQVTIDEADPYAGIIQSIRRLLALGIRPEHNLDGKMSEDEHQTLIAIDEFIAQRDN